MEFIGEDGCPAPLLKNVLEMDEELADQLYVECVTIMRNMYRKCRLVHAGISFNFLLILNFQISLNSTFYFMIIIL